MSPSATDPTPTKSISNSDNVVPVVDFSKFHSSSTEVSRDAARELFAAFKNSGFVYLQNHGVPQEVVDEAFSWNAKFFSLPQSIKDKVPHPPEGWWHRGYSGVGLEKVSQMVFDSESLAELRKVPDIKESFEMGKENNDAMPNIWLPEEDLPGFRAFFNSFYAQMNELKFEILRALATGMGIDREYFVDFHLNADNQTRILHYPAVSEELLRLGKAERIAAHSDFGTLTVLFQDKVGGLEVEDPKQEGVFHSVPHIPGTCVVNVGDFLQMWSNDILKSTKHRVRAPPAAETTGGEAKMTPERYSIPYFVGPDVEKTMECVPGCYGPDRPKKYGATTVGEYINMRMNAIY